MKKIFQTLSILALSAFLYSDSFASDAPGYQDPGSRVPPRTPAPAPAPKKPAPKKVAPRQAPKPKPAPKVANPLDDGKALLEQGLYTQAKPYLLRAVKGQPKNAYSWYYLGLCYEKTGDFENAQKNYTIAIQLDRQLPMLSRVVVYPDDPNGKIPLWDTIRPARIEKIDAPGVNGLGETPLASRNDNPAPPMQKAERELAIYIPPEPEFVETEMLDEEVKK